jgi:hypothetical protein
MVAKFTKEWAGLRHASDSLEEFLAALTEANGLDYCPARCRRVVVSTSQKNLSVKLTDIS